MLSNSFTSRIIVPEDAPVIAQIMREAQSLLDEPSMYIINTEKRILQRIETDSIGTALVIDRKLVAFAFYKKTNVNEFMKSINSVIPAISNYHDKVLEVDTLAVKPQYQRQGFGRLLLEDAISKAKALHCSMLLATVDPRNVGSMQNFLSSGFKVIDTVKAYSNASPKYIIDEIWQEVPDACASDIIGIDRNILQLDLIRA